LMERKWAFFGRPSSYENSKNVVILSEA